MSINWSSPWVNRSLILGCISLAGIGFSVDWLWPLHVKPGADCILLKYEAGVTATPTRPYWFIITCPEGIGSGSTWGEAGDDMKKQAILPYSSERVWRP